MSRDTLSEVRQAIERNGAETAGTKIFGERQA
jgi:hypothetical protein